MKTPIISFLFWLLFPCLLLSQQKTQYAASRIAPGMLINANEVIRSDYGEFIVHSKEAGTVYRKTVVTILNEDSRANHLFFPYSNQKKVRKIDISIYDARGNEIRKVKRSDLEDYSAIADYSIYDDARYKYYQVNHYAYPFTIEYEYEEDLSGIPFASFPNWFIQSDYNCSVESSVFKMKLPKDMDFYYRVLNREDQVIESQEKKSDVYTWAFTNVPALNREINMPPGAEVFPVIITAPNQFKIDKYEGSMSSWEEFSAFIHQLFDGKDELPDDFVQEIKSKTRQAVSSREKVEILYRYLQENYRYVSVQLDLGGWQPFDANYVYHNKFGDCKALTNFMAAMLKVVGVKAYPALIGNGSMFYQVTEDFTTPIFNHVILYIPEIDYWLECTSNRYPPNYVGSGNANRQALLIKEKGGHLVKTPELTSEENRREGKTQIRFREDASASIRTTIVTWGDQHEIYRAIESEMTEFETRKWLEENSTIPSVSFQAFTVESRQQLPETSITYEAESRRYGAVAGKRIFLPMNVINNSKNIPPKQENRQFPVVIKNGFKDVDTISFDLPSGYVVESIPEKETVFTNDFGSFRLQINLSGNYLEVVREVEIRRSVLPPEKYTDYRNFFKQIAKADSQKIVLVKERP